MSLRFLKNTFSDEKDRQLARIIMTVIAAAWTGYFSVACFGIYFGDRSMISATIFGAVVLLVPFVLLRMGRILASSWAVSLAVLGTLMVLATIGQGHEDLALMCFPVILVFTAITLDRRIFMINTGLIIAVIAWLVFGEMHGLYTPLQTTTSPRWTDFMLFMVIMLVCAFIIDVLVRNMRANLLRAQQEIAGRKAVEAKLLRREVLLNSVGRMADVGGWELDVAAAQLEWTDQVYRIHDVGDGFIPTVQNAIGYYAPEAQPVISQAVQSAIEEGTPFDLELPIITAKGNRRIVHAIGEARRCDGKTVSVFGTFQDITERKTAEGALRESEEKYRLLHEHAGIGIGYYKPDGTLLSYNIAAARHMNGRPEDFAGKSVFEIFTKQEAEFYLGRISSACQSDDPVVYEDNIPLPTGDKCFLSTFTRIIDSHNNILGIQIMSQDITERKRATEALQNMQKLESLGVLAGGIAHDFNNLLGGIYGYIDMAGESAKDEKLSRYISKAMTTIERARGLTSQLLTFAKGGAPVRKVEQLFPFVQETAQFALSGSNVSCEYTVPAGLWQCRLDRNQIGQVIDNIIINAK